MTIANLQVKVGYVQSHSIKIGLCTYE